MLRAARLPLSAICVIAGVLLALGVCLFYAPPALSHPCDGPGCVHDHGPAQCGTLPNCQGPDCPPDPACALQDYKKPIAPAKSSQAKPATDQSTEKEPDQTIQEEAAGGESFLYKIGFPSILLSWQVFVFLAALGIASRRIYPPAVILAVTALVAGFAGRFEIEILQAISDQYFLVGATSMVVAGVALISPASVKNIASIIASIYLGIACGLLCQPYWSETPTLIGTGVSSTIAIIVPFALSAFISSFFDGKIFTIVTRILGSWLAAAGIMLAALALYSY